MHVLSALHSVQSILSYYDRASHALRLNPCLVQVVLIQQERFVAGLDSAESVGQEEGTLYQ